MCCNICFCRMRLTLVSLLALAGRNIFNYVNFATPIGNLSSPFFGEANALAGQPYSSSTANRRIDLQVTFAF